MNEELRWRITAFFDYWRKRHTFISALELPEYRHEANVLVWAALDALSNLWAESIGKIICSNKGKRIIFDTFLARYGGEFFQLVSLPDIWYRVDQGDVWVDPRNKLKLSEDVRILLGNIGGRRTPTLIEDHYQLRSISEDMSMDALIDEILVNYPETNRTDLEQWLTLSRYGAIAYKVMRNPYIHEGRQGKNTHDYELYGYTEQPTYRSTVYTTPPMMGFNIKFMWSVLGRCIEGFEADALALQVDPVPEQ